MKFSISRRKLHAERGEDALDVLDWGEDDPVEGMLMLELDEGLLQPPTRSSCKSGFHGLASILCFRGGSSIACAAGAVDIAMSEMWPLALGSRQI
jgi:hypothetical protein